MLWRSIMTLHIQAQVPVWIAVLSYQLGIFMTNNTLRAFPNGILSTDFVHYISKSTTKQGWGGVACDYIQLSPASHFQTGKVKSGSMHEMSSASRESWKVFGWYIQCRSQCQSAARTMSNEKHVALRLQINTSWRQFSCRGRLNGACWYAELIELVQSKLTAGRTHPCPTFSTPRSFYFPSPKRINSNLLTDKILRRKVLEWVLIITYSEIYSNWALYIPWLWHSDSGRFDLEIVCRTSSLSSECELPTYYHY